MSALQLCALIAGGLMAGQLLLLGLWLGLLKTCRHLNRRLPNLVYLGADSLFVVCSVLLLAAFCTLVGLALQTAGVLPGTWPVFNLATTALALSAYFHWRHRSF